ncbi:MAG TPA: amidohydrolase family protein [Candidatus Polarisedimenticolia bacterium]|nr:amidohydrolase family protein [Candidatus Polarisedimenticolia bacterium]
MAGWAAAAAALLLGAGAGGAQERDAAPREVLVKGATIWTVSDAGILDKGDLLVRDGRIVAVTASIDPPRGALVIDGSGKHVTPGLIDAHSHTAVDGSVNEGSNNVTAEVRIGDVLDPEDPALYRELAGGLTAANVLHGSANSIGGQNQVIKLKWGVTAEELKFRGAPQGIKFALGENPKRSNFSAPGSTPRYPSTRMGVEQSIRERFLAARRYDRGWAEYGRLKPKQQARLEPPRRDLQLEAIAEILRGERLVHSHCYRQDEILMLIRLAEEFGFRVATFQHVLEGYKVADEIARHGAGASTFSDWWAYKLEAWDATPFNGALMARRGVSVSFNSDSDELARRMNLEAAKGVKYGGMDEQEAIKLVTLNPARQLGIGGRVGSLEPGKDADFVIWSGHPFSVYTIAEQTWVDGRLEFGVEQDRQRRRQVEARRAELIGKVSGGGAKKESGSSKPASPEAGPPARPIPPARPLAYRDRTGPAGAFAIVGATVHTVSGGDIPAGVVVTRDGRIVSVGTDSTIPSDALVVDGKGLHLYPGMIDASTVLGLTEIGSVAGGVDVSETGKINPDVRVESAVNPDSELIPVTRAAGITHVLTVPRGGTLAGTSAFIRLDGWTWEDLAAGAPAAMHMNFPAFPRAAGPGFGFGPRPSLEDQEKQRKADLKELEETFEAARAYRQAVRAAREHGTEAPAADPALEAMIPVIEGALPVVVSASEVRQIKAAVEWTRRQGVRMILESSGDAWRVAELLKQNDIPVIAGPVLSSSFRADEPYDTAYAMPRKLHEAGVRFCIVNGGGSFGASSTRNLPYQAGMAAAFGLPREAALKAVTLFPAQILGVGDRLGSIETGKSASLILTDGDPLEIRTRVLKVFIDGRDVDLGNRHQRLYDKYRQRPLPAAVRAGG